jgi:hypothetical protein
MFETLFLSLADFKTVQAPAAPAPALTRDILPAMIPLGLLLGALFLLVWLWRIWTRKPPVPDLPKRWILVDGSNVMHWQDNAPSLDPLHRVVEHLTALNYAPAVVFDANAGWKLFDRYLDDGDLARLLLLPEPQVLVVPKGTPADPFLLATARDLGARIVTNDRYRDWAETYPQVTEPGFLIWGGMKSGKLWLKGMEPAPKPEGVKPA